MDGYGLGSVYGWLWSRKCIWLAMLLECIWLAMLLEVYMAGYGLGVYMAGYAIGVYMAGYAIGSVYGWLWSRKCIWMAMV